MNVRDLIRDHEGTKLKPYTDTVGKLSIGCGRNLTDVGISAAEADLLLDNDIHSATQALLAAYPWFFHLSEVRQAAMIDLKFNLGNRLTGFVDFLAAMARGSWSGAGEELEDSAWFRQVARRGPRIVSMITSGEWPT